MGVAVGLTVLVGWATAVAFFVAVGVGVPIPILNEEIAAFTGVSDEEIFTHVIDYSHDYSHGIDRNYGQVSYAELKNGQIEVNGKTVQTSPLSSVVRAREIAETLKKWIDEDGFELGTPVKMLPSGS